MNARIASVETFMARYPIVGRFKFLNQATRDTVVVKLTTDTGAVGWGQSVPSPTWSYETMETVRTTIDRYLAPAIIGIDAHDINSVWREMNRAIAPSFSTGQPIAKAAIDLALHDLAQRPHVAGAVTLSWTLDTRSFETLEASIADAHSRGYRHFNLKISRDITFVAEAARIVRNLAPDAFVWADANCACDLDAASDAARLLADFGFAALEQPLPANDFAGYRRLRALGALPILMDEPIVSLADLRAFHELDLLDGVAMKVSRCGGLTEAFRIVEYMRQHGLLFFASGLTDPDLSLAASLQFFNEAGLERPAALNAPQFLSGSILREPVVVRGDQAEVPAGPGLGVEVNEAALEA